MYIVVQMLKCRNVCWRYCQTFTVQYCRQIILFGLVKLSAVFDCTSHDIIQNWLCVMLDMCGIVLYYVWHSALLHGIISARNAEC